jgi:hypothetical protein
MQVVLSVSDRITHKEEKTMKKNFLLALLALLIASLACNFGGALPVAQNTNNEILFQDDFSSTSSGWDSVNQSDGITDYTDGAYRIYVNKPQFDFWANPGRTDLPADVRVEVDVTKTAGPDVNDIGVICRSTKTDASYNFYYFVISSDGFANISKIVDNESTILAEQTSEALPAVKIGNASNHLRADCVGTMLTFYVNGQQVLSATDATHTGGDVGLIAGTFDEVGTDVLFDNFLVTKP